MGKTEDNLQHAFAGESQANRKYLFFAEKADKEGYPQIARLFRATAEAETVHANNHFDALDGVGSTADNLKAAIAGEHEEFSEMYPPMLEQAKADKNSTAELSFDYANKVEKIHHGHFTRALKALEEGTELKEQPYYVCQVCGHTVAGEPPDTCPICGNDKSMFKKID